MDSALLLVSTDPSARTDDQRSAQDGRSMAYAGRLNTGILESLSCQQPDDCCGNKGNSSAQWL